MKHKLKNLIAKSKRLIQSNVGHKGQIANFKNLMFKGSGAFDAVYAEAASTSAFDDRALVVRLCDAYSLRKREEIGRSMWNEFFTSHHGDVNDILLSKDYDLATCLLRMPAMSNIFYGFDIFNKDYISYFKSRHVQEAYANLCFDGLVRFAEAVGTFPLENPEAGSSRPAKKLSIDSVILSLQETLRWKLDSPNPFTSEPGLASSIGVISYRVPQAMFQALRIKHLLAGIKHPRVIEIGAGLGRTAYYSQRLGIKNYTIVDLPVSNAAQGYFLGRTLGDTSVWLEGEPDCSDLDNRVKIISPASFRKLDQRYDLIVNFDSFTEMDKSIAAGYWEKSKSISNTILSVNHETNIHRVRDLFSDDPSVFSSERHCYWMRRGYVEEIVRWC